MLIWMQKNLPEKFICLDEYFGNDSLQSKGKMKNFGETISNFALYYGLNCVCFRTLEPKMITKTVQTFGANNVQVFSPKKQIPDYRFFIKINLNN